MNTQYTAMSRPSYCPPCPEEEHPLEWVGDVALLLNVMSVVPQIYHVYSKRDAKSLSWMWMLSSFTANILWFIFGYVKNVPLLMRTGTFFAVVFVILGSMKFWFERKH